MSRLKPLRGHHDGLRTIDALPPHESWRKPPMALNALLDTVEAVDPDGVIDGVTEAELVRTEKAPMALSVFRGWASEVAYRELREPLAQAELHLLQGEHQKALAELRQAMMLLVEEYDPGASSAAMMAGVVCAVSWLRDFGDLVANAHEPAFALAGPAWIPVPGGMWEVPHHGASRAALMEMCVPMVATLVRCEHHNDLGPDLDPKFVQQRMLGDSLDDVGERPGWIIMAWVLDQGLLPKWWPGIEALADKDGECESDEGIFTIDREPAHDGHHQEDADG